MRHYYPLPVRMLLVFLIAWLTGRGISSLAQVRIPGPGGSAATVAYYCRSITIDHTKVPGTLTDFPVLVSGTYAYLATEANGGKVKNPNGYDIRFYPSSDCSGTKLKWETETWSATTGAVNYWVKVASVSSSTDTVISVRYGESGINSDESDPTAVWDSNYKGVWHVPDGTTLGLTDSTSIGSTLTNSSATAGAGKIDGGAVLGGTAYLSATTNLTEYDPVTAFTLTGWVYVDSGSWNDPDGALFGKNSTTGYMVYQNTSGGLLYINGSNRGIITLPSADAWHYFALVWDGTDYKFYWDGSGTATLTYTSSTAPNSAGANLYLGAYATDRRMKGKIDEYRYSNTNRSMDWRAAEYSNQNSPSTFYAVGAEVAH